MNLSELRELKDGDKVKFVIPFPPFTEGKEYAIIDTGTGRIVYDDNGLGRYLGGSDELNDRFQVVHT